MGRVYLAEHVVMKDLWAVKILAEELTQRQDVVTRFVDEARAAARVRHRNLVRVYQIDQAPHGPWYMVLEYLEGCTLGTFLASHSGPLSSELVVRIICQLGNALGVIHKQGIIHRDIKPENVFLVPRDGDRQFPILLDLGVAHLGEELARGPSTQTGLLIGTPSYMPPEQILGEKVFSTADIFALGVLVYEMSTGGWLPWQRDDERPADYHRLLPTELYRRHTAGAAIDPRRRVAGMTDAFAKAVLAPLDPDQTKRPQSVKAFVRMLAHAAPTDGIARDGLAIVREYAPELLNDDTALDETIRSASPVILSAAGTEARYVLGAKLGQGGMAEVFHGSQIGISGFERPVAIKRILSSYSVQQAFVEMFTTEARIASRLAHPNCVAVLDFRKDDQNRLFLVMEFVEGKDLAALLDAGPIPASTTIYVVVEVLRGLGYAHDRLDPVSGTRGVVHRDVSPHNVLVSYEGEVKLADFGLARARDAAGNAHTSTVRGKPSYMAPEQVAAEPLDNRSDLFAVGVILWEMLAHQPLFAGSIKETMAQVLFMDLRRPSQVRDGVPADLEAVAMRLLARERGDRFPTAEAAIAVLLRCADARLDGRDSLVRLLAERFPRAGDVGSHRAIDVRSSRERRAEQVTAPAVPSTLGGAASQSIPVAVPSIPVAVPPPRVTKRRYGLVGGLVIAVIAGVVGGAVLARHRAEDSLDGAEAPRTASLAATPPDAAPAVAVVADAQPLDPGASTADAALPDAPPTAALVVDAGDAGRTTSSRPRASVAKGTLRVRVSPWADVTVDGVSLGTTPIDAKLTIGRHRIVLETERTKKTIIVNITAEKPVTIQETLP